MTLPATISPKVLVSWDGSGAFTGPYDDVTSDVLVGIGSDTEHSLTWDLGKDGSRALDPPKAVAGAFELRNDDGKYSQERADSPVYQLVIPGRPIKIQALHGDADTYDAATAYDETDYYDGVGTYTVARLIIDDIGQTPDLGDQRVSISALGIEALLVATKVTVGVMTAPRVDQCVTAILDAVGWPSADRSIAVSDTTLLYWWCDDRTPWDALLELLASEGPGAMYVDAGVFHFENRNYRTTATRSTTSQATFFDEDAGPSTPYDEADTYDAEDYYDGAASGLWFTALSYDPGFKNIYNRATYTTRVRTLQASAAVWTYGASLVLAASESVTLIARPNDPFQNAITPVSPTDFTVAGGTVSVSLAATSGLVAFITITATSGTPTVSGLQLRAQALTSAYETTYQNTVDASGSIAKFSPIPGQNIPRVLDLNGWPEISRGQAQGVCDAWISRYMVQRPAVTIGVAAADGDLTLEMLRRAISDRITLGERNTGISADVWINAKDFEVTGSAGRRFTCVMRCEKVDEVGGSVWDTALWDLGTWGI